MKSSDLESGMSKSAAASRLDSEGANELPAQRSHGLWTLLMGAIREPMVFLLLACGLLYSVIGDVHEALMLLAFLFLMVVLTLVQGFRSERALQKLREIAAPRALVIRDGEWTRIPGREVVREDLVILREGDRVPADGELISGDPVWVDESLLTGESQASEKNQVGAPLFAGTLVTRGQGRMRVMKIGRESQLGKIGVSLLEIKRTPTRLEAEIHVLVRRVLFFSILMSVILSVVFSLARGDLTGGILFGLSLAMAILPNEIPAVLMIFFSMGAARMARIGVITRNRSALENLGSVTTICADKTGTLTLNQMQVNSIWTEAGSWNAMEEGGLPESVHEVIEYAVLSCRDHPDDPMERAILSFGTGCLTHTEHLHLDWQEVKDYPLSKDWFTTKAWKKTISDHPLVVGAKGAPEVMISLCGLNAYRSEAILKQIQTMTEEGLRVLAVAKTEMPEPLLPEHQSQFQFQFVGLIGLKDPARPGVQEFIRECVGAGIRVIMMTGDHPGTALSIAKELGIPTDAGVLTGREMDGLSDLDFSRVIGVISVFSRLTPSHKLRMVKLLQARGEHVAMTGDGVNDAEALKCANVGIAMGERGTDVAREAADLVLQHDDFGSILAAIKAGRGVRENLREAFQYLFSVHVPLVGLSILPALFRLPQVLLPIHIAVLHLVIEPVCSLAFESEPKSVGVLKLDKAQSPIFDQSTLKSAAWVGLKVFLALALVYFFAWYRGKGEWDTRGLTFSTLLFANSALLIRQAKRSETRKRLWFGLGGGSLALFFFGAQFKPILELLKVNPIHPLDWIVTAILGALGGW